MDDLAFPTEAISALLELVFVVAIPFVVYFIARYVHQNVKDVRSRMNDRERGIFDRADEVGVKSAEQQGLSGLIPSGAAKKQEAIRIAEQYLEQFDLQIDVGRMADMIEAEVLSQFSHPTAPTLGPAQRAQVLDKAVELSVLAAEQSGLTGAILNEGAKRKEYAISFAERYLKEHGIKVELDVVGDMIEAQLIKLLMDARQKVYARA